jgi:hypothetical protein
VNLAIQVRAASRSQRSDAANLNPGRSRDLHDRDPAAFDRMSRALEDGEPLARALPDAFGADLRTVWDDFVRSPGRGG